MSTENDDEVASAESIFGTNSVFEGPCTCEHPSEQHTWGECDVTDDVGNVCECTAGWWE